MVPARLWPSVLWGLGWRGLDGGLGARVSVFGGLPSGPGASTLLGPFMGIAHRQQRLLCLALSWAQGSRGGASQGHQLPGSHVAPRAPPPPAHSGQPSWEGGWGPQLRLSTTQVCLVAVQLGGGGCSRGPLCAPASCEPSPSLPSDRAQTWSCGKRPGLRGRWTPRTSRWPVTRTQVRGPGLLLADPALCPPPAARGPTPPPGPSQPLPGPGGVSVAPQPGAFGGCRGWGLLSPGRAQGLGARRM